MSVSVSASAFVPLSVSVSVYVYAYVLTCVRVDCYHDISFVVSCLSLGSSLVVTTV